MGVPVHPGDIAALILSIKVIDISGIRKHPEPVAIVHVLPLRISNPARILRFAHPRAVVLHTAVNPIRVFVIDADVIELRYWQVLALPPFAAAVRSEEHTSELQSHVNLVCRLLLEKKKINKTNT